MTAVPSLPATLRLTAWLSAAALAIAAAACAAAPAAAPAGTAPASAGSESTVPWQRTSTVAPTSVTTASVPATTKAAGGAVPPTTAAPAGGGVRAVDWKTFTHPADTCRPDGSEAFATANPGATVVYGDLTGDGRDEVVVSVACDTEGTLHWSSVSIYTGDASAPGGVRRLAKVQPFAAGVDARFLHDAAVSGGRVTTGWRVFADDDPNCCPSKYATVTQHWNGTALVNDGAPTYGDPPRD